MKALAIAALIALIAGCAAPEPAARPEAPAQAGGPIAASAPATNGSAPVGGPLALYFLADGAMGARAAERESSVPLVTPLNSPFTGAYPKWNGTAGEELPAHGNVTLHLFVTSSSASLAANSVIVFSDLPGIGATVKLGNVTVQLAVQAPPVVRVGEVVELVATAPYAAKGPIPAGAAVAYGASVYFTHVVGAAEFRYVLGPEHPTRVELSG
jgi:hypothetical protein